jgi:hypothetical protein
MHAKLIIVPIGFILSLLPATAQWQKTAAPPSPTFWVAALCDTTVLAGALNDSAYLIRFNEAAHKWTSAQTGMAPNNPASNAVVCPKMFVGTETGGVYLSDNHGLSWVPVNNGLPIVDSAIVEVKVMAAKGNRIFAGTWGCGLYETKDEGASWTRLNLDTSLALNSIAFEGDTILAGTNQPPGIFASFDDGQTWERVNNGLNLNFPIRALGIFGNRYFAGTEGGGLYISTNHGVSWKHYRNDNIGNVISTITVNGSMMIITSYNGVFVSFNGGKRWTDVNEGLRTLEIYDLAVTSNSVFTATVSGIYKRPLYEIEALCR